MSIRLSLARIRRIQSRKPNLRVRVRWARRYGARWFKRYPWYIIKLGWFEIGRHWRTERIYAVFARGTSRIWLLKAGANV